MVNAFALFLTLADLQTAQSQLKLASSWDKVAPMVAVVSSQGRPTGLAVVVSSDGILLAHQDSVPLGSGVQIMLSGPRIFTADVVGRDPVTGLVGLKATGWPVTGRPFAQVASSDPQPQSLLMAATLAGPMQGQAARNRADGHLGNSNRFVPLIEVRFEQTSNQVAGAILFDQSGQLIGVLGATLADRPAPAPAQKSVAAMAITNRGESSPLTQSADFGPQALTTAYALGTPVLARVVRGFASPSHTVKHPTIGISFRDENGLNRVTRVDAGSSAFVAGMRDGDVVVSVGPRAVKSSVELASALFELEIGEVSEITVARGTEKVVLKVRVSGS